MSYLWSCFDIARQFLAQSRQDLAHATICSSLGNFSQAVAHSSQHFAQHSSICLQSGLFLAQRVEHALQHSAQSAHSWAVALCSTFPFATRSKQWAKQVSHSTWQREQISAHFFIIFGSSLCWADANIGISAANAIAASKGWNLNIANLFQSKLDHLRKVRSIEQRAMHLQVRNPWKKI